jgi:hypothetical protein
MNPNKRIRNISRHLLIAAALLREFHSRRGLSLKMSFGFFAWSSRPYQGYAVRTRQPSPRACGVRRFTAAFASASVPPNVPKSFALPNDTRQPQEDMGGGKI